MKKAGKLSAALMLALFFIISAAFMQNDDLFFQIKKQLSIFSDVYKQIAIEYVDEVSPEEFMRIGIDSMLEELDPYTVFIPEGEQQQMEILSSGSYGGIGIDAGYRGEDIVIVAPLEGYPAQKAGLRPGDIIKEINGQATSDMTPEEVQQLTIGDVGTTIQLTIERPGISEDLEFELERERIEIKNINIAEKVGSRGQYGYVQLVRFGQQAAEELRQELQTFNSDGDFEGLILDLRNNPGGLLNEAVAIVDKFIEPGVTIVETRGRRDEHNTTISSDEPALFSDLPIVVLINSGSASASEIVAGALQDLDRAVILGSKSFGKGLVQTVKPLSYNTSLKLTISKYYIPSGRSIQSVDYSSDLNDNAPIVQRREFKTKNGRTVYDGLGIEPDLDFDENGNTMLDVALKRENKYFFFVNEMVGEYGATEPDDLFEKFTTSLIQENFTFETPVDRHLKEIASNVNSFSQPESAMTGIEELKALSRDYKISQIYDNQQYIERELMSEWITQTKSGSEKNLALLQLDNLVNESINLLGNNYEYQSILRP
ncbi:MAG TPA: S41 family peptidase [Balneolaceae bacterium]|nr:S41 family peptidase [Balneolaceae bacterium]